MMGEGEGAAVVGVGLGPQWLFADPAPGGRIVYIIEPFLPVLAEDSSCRRAVSLSISFFNKMLKEVQFSSFGRMGRGIFPIISARVSLIGASISPPLMAFDSQATACLVGSEALTSPSGVDAASDWDELVGGLRLSGIESAVMVSRSWLNGSGARTGVDGVLDSVTICSD